MINYNLVVYIGIAFYVLIFFLFIKNEMNKSKLDRAKFNSDRLNDSFNNNVQLLNTPFKAQRKSYIARGKKWTMKIY